MSQPGILLLLTDQQRWDALGAAGNPHIHTPNLDRLAAEGVRFENAFCNAPVCMPSRQSLLSGRYPSALGCCCNGIEMREDTPTLQSLLGERGVFTANLGKLHFKNHASRDHTALHPAYGFDKLVISDEAGAYEDDYIRWVRRKDPEQVERCRASTPPAWEGEPVVRHPRQVTTPYVFEGPESLTHSAFVAEAASETIQEAGDRPFFIVAGFVAPHNPLNPPRRFVDLYDPATLPSPVLNEGEDRYGLSEAEWRRVKAYYYALVSHVDDQVGRILRTLEACGRREDTVVVFTSDHGELLGDHGQVGKGPPGYDSCTHVPLLVSWPGTLRGGVRRSELIELVDIAPTLFDLCGLERPETFQGRSFANLLRGGDYEPRSSAFTEFRIPFDMSWKTVRTLRHKYSVSNRGEELLFDLDADPWELSNAAGNERYEETLNALRMELLRRWFDVEEQLPRRTARY